MRLLALYPAIFPAVRMVMIVSNSHSLTFWKSPPCMLVEPHLVTLKNVQKLDIREHFLLSVIIISTLIKIINVSSIAIKYIF